MSGVNKVILVGNVGRDPEVREITNGKMASITLATSEKWYKDGEKKEKTEWHRVTFFGKLVDVVEKYVNKGTMLYVEGKLSTRKYEKDGETRYATDITANSMQMLGYSQQHALGGKLGNNEPQSPAEDDDLPF